MEHLLVDVKAIKSSRESFAAILGLACEGLGTQKAHKHRHFIGISYLIGPHYKGVYMRYPYPYTANPKPETLNYMGYPYPNFCLGAFLGPLNSGPGSGVQSGGGA